MKTANRHKEDIKPYKIDLSIDLKYILSLCSIFLISPLYSLFNSYNSFDFTSKIQTTFYYKHID